MTGRPASNKVRPPSRRFVLAGGAAGLLSAVGLSRAQGIAPHLAGDWLLNGNGFAGILRLQHLFNGRMGGQMYTADDVLQGYYCTSTLQLTLVRSRHGDIGQVFVGQVYRGGLVISGEFYALSAAWGATPDRNRFGFAANRSQLGAPTSALPPQTRGSVGCLPPHMVVANRPAEFGHNWLINLNFTQSWFSCVAHEVTGSIDGDPIFGHYALNSGSLVFLRLRNGVPFQFYRGMVSRAGLLEPVRIRGDFLALSDEAGASAQRMAFDWETT